MMRVSIVFLGILLLHVSCSEKDPVFEKFGGLAQGTTYSIVFESRNGLTASVLKEKVDSLLLDFDMSLSLYKDSSVLSRINRNEDIAADKHLARVYEESRIAYELTDGAFDVTVGPLVRAWGFGPEAKKNFSERKRDSLMRLVGMDKISLVEGKIVKENPAINIDFNAIAQGYSVDVVRRYFKSLGLDNFLVEIGGEVGTEGNKTGEGWKVGIDKPVDNNNSPGENLQAIISLSGKALATSGNYRKFYIENGVKYSHTIDPKTGFPAKNSLLSATVIADDCSMADAIATACMVMGTEKAIEFLGRNKQFQAYLVYSGPAGEYITWMSEGMNDLITEI